MASTNVLDDYAQFREKLLTDLGVLERALGDIETHYHQAEFSQPGTVLKGFEGFLSSKDNMRKRQRSYKPDDRLFSMSSKSSPITKEMEAAALEQAELTGVAPRKVGGTFSHKGYAQKRYAEKGKR